MPTLSEDIAFLNAHGETVVLGSATGPNVIVSPTYQGRVMTSGASQDRDGHGWINQELISKGELVPHINPYGGEDRLWLGPEGGQFSIFFKPGEPFDLAHWQTPALIDTLPFEVVQASATSVSLRADAELVNTSGFTFDVRLSRTIKLLDEARAGQLLDIAPVPVVAFESDNHLTNRGSRSWSKATGLLSLWNLGMFKHSPTTVVIAPFKPGPVEELGPTVNAAYFGQVPADRLKVTGTHVFFKGDGEVRSKIGLSPARAMPVIGSYDPAQGALTIVQFTIPPGATDYVNSMWEFQEHPFAGDVSNSYNDGPPAPGVPPLGPFYELESSSPALALSPGDTGTHVHRTFHFTGDSAPLSAICERVLGCSLDEAAAAFV